MKLLQYVLPDGKTVKGLNADVVLLRGGSVCDITLCGVSRGPKLKPDWWGVRLASLPEVGNALRF